MRLRKIWLLCNLVCIIPGAFAQQFIHPGVLHSEKSLERIKRLVDQKAQPAYGSYEILAKLPEARADYQMKGPFEIISRDGKYGYTKGPSERDFNSAYYNALLWKITGKKAHADKSMEIIRAYARTVRQIPPTNDAPLCAGLQGFILVNAAEIMRYTYMETHYPNGWSEQDTECVEAMFRKVFQPVLSKFFQTAPYTNGNWGIAVAKAQLSFGVFLNDRKLYDDAIDCSVLNKLTLQKSKIKMKYSKKQYNYYSDDERMSYIREYLSSPESKSEFCKRHGFCAKLLTYWLNKYQIEDKDMGRSSKPVNSDAIDSSISELQKELSLLRAENRKLHRALADESLRHEACEELINLAESTYHIKVRKNSDAK